MRKDYTVIKNEKKIGNDEYIKLIETMVDSMKLIDHILSSYSEESVGNEEEELYQGMTVDEIKAMRYIEELEEFSIKELNYVTKAVGDGIYFSRRMNTLFMNTLEELKFNIIKLQDKINYSLPVNFEEEHEKEFKEILRNINYCVLTGFEMFGIVDGGTIQMSVRAYAIKNNIDIEEMATTMIEYYRDNRPTMPLLTKYPELLAELEEYIPDEYFFDIVDLSSLMKRDEITDIIKGDLEITDSYIEVLEFRLAGDTDA